MMSFNSIAVTDVLGGGVGRSALCLALFYFAVTILQRAFDGKVRRAASVPIVSMTPGTKLRDARKKFYLDAQKMLLEGYKTVSRRKYL
jgi:hypothetical protein